MLKVALIGYGYWGSKLARNFQNLEAFNLVSIADTKPRNLLIAKKNYPLAKAFSNYKKAIRNNKIDLVELNYKPYPFLLANTFEKKINCFKNVAQYVIKQINDNKSLTIFLSDFHFPNISSVFFFISSLSFLRKSIPLSCILNFPFPLAKSSINFAYRTTWTASPTRM